MCCTRNFQQREANLCFGELWLQQCNCAALNSPRLSKCRKTDWTAQILTVKRVVWWRLILSYNLGNLDVLASLFEQPSCRPSSHTVSCSEKQVKTNWCEKWQSDYQERMIAKLFVNVFFNTCSGRSRAVHIQSSLSERARWYSGSRLYDFACFSFSCWVRLLQDNSATISIRHRKYIREHSEARICHETRLEVLLNGRRVKMNTETPGGLLE